MRTVEEIKADLKDCYACEQKECLFPIPTICGKPQDASVIAYEAEVGKAIINLFGIDRLEEVCNAEREGRCVVLPLSCGQPVRCIEGQRVLSCTVKDVLINQGGAYRFTVVGDCYTPTLKSVESIGKTVFLTRKAAEAALKEREKNDRD